MSVRLFLCLEEKREVENYYDMVLPTKSNGEPLNPVHLFNSNNKPIEWEWIEENEVI